MQQVCIGPSDIAMPSHNPVFPRVNVWDPYKRLGVSRDASEEEILEARNFLLEQYAGDERSFESIEAAFEKIIMTSFRERKKSKINLKSKLKKKVDESPPWVRSIVDTVEIPDKKTIQNRAALFFIIAIWSVFRSFEGGPVFQESQLVAILEMHEMMIKTEQLAGIYGPLFDFVSLSLSLSHVITLLVIYGCLFDCASHRQ
ncbi:hypothetical protein KI387_028502, partial [Taxus chinensis]